MKRKIILSLLTVSLLAAGTGCKKSYFDTNPSDRISGDDLFKTTASAYTALHGMHALMNTPLAANISTTAYHSDFGFKTMDLISDVMGNDMVDGLGGGTYDWFGFYHTYAMTEASTYWGPYLIWYFYYRTINNANNILDKIDAAAGPEDERNDIKGQALAYRAWALYQLTLYFQFTYQANPDATGVPIYTEGTVAGSLGKPRGTLREDYAQIVKDLDESIALLATATSHTDNKSHISLDAARGIYARVALTMGDNAKALEMAGRALQAYPLMSPSQYTAGFNSNANPEWMWASALSTTQMNDAGIISFISFIDQNCPGYAQVGATRSITKRLYDTIGTNDVRKQMWSSTSFLQTKFRATSSSGFIADNLYMRSAEMYLIGAEAAYRSGDISTAEDLLGQLLTSRNATKSVPETVDGALLQEILLQRRIELWGEGFAWLDLKRLRRPLARPTGSGNHRTAIATMIELAPASDRFNFKVPQRELDINLDF